MKKFLLLSCLLMILGASFAFPRNSVGIVGIYASSSARESRTSATFFTNHYSEIYDSSILIFHVRVPTVAEPRFTEYIRATYFDILGHSGSSYATPWGCFNRILELAVYDTAPPPPLWDTLNASFEKTSPILINLESTTEDSIFIKVTSDNTVGTDPFYLHAFILENHMDLSGSPTGGYSQIGRDVFPSAIGYKFAIAPNTILDIHLAYERILTWNHRELELAITVADSSSSQIIQSCHGELPFPKYMHSVYTVGPVSYLINPGDSVEFRIKIENFGGSPDTFAVRSSFSSPAGWTSEFCTSDTSFTDSGFVLADTNSTKEISIYIKSDSSNPGIGTVEITLESQGGKSYTFYFSAASGGPILVIDDAPSISGKYYRQVLDSLEADYFYIKRTDMFNMHNFAIVIWFTGSNNTSTLLEIDQDAIAHFLIAGGKVFISGAQIGTDLALDGSGTDVAFFQHYLGASGNPAELLESSPILEVSGVDGNIISKGLSFNITGGDGANNSSISNVITPYDAQPIFYYGDGKNFCAGVQLELGFKVVYLPFCFEAIDNFDDRFTLMNRILNWFGYYPPSILERPSDMAVEQISCLSIKSYPNPFNAICEIQYTLPNSGSLAFHDLSGRLLEEVSVSGTGTYIWKADNLSSGIYFVRLIQKNRSLSKKIILLK